MNVLFFSIVFSAEGSDIILVCFVVFSFMKKRITKDNGDSSKKDKYECEFFAVIHTLSIRTKVNICKKEA